MFSCFLQLNSCGGGNGGGALGELAVIAPAIHWCTNPSSSFNCSPPSFDQVMISDNRILLVSRAGILTLLASCLEIHVFFCRKFYLETQSQPLAV